MMVDEHQQRNAAQPYARGGGRYKKDAGKGGKLFLDKQAVLDFAQSKYDSNQKTLDLRNISQQGISIS
jgi:hypothetical protein